ncbi:MAG: hypothetical protein NMNS01_25690 [Nitrosomonas sp.]|nr:MAG: hypothetical protein NMNS01_25690 [Nitrosomonas sp.]
MQPDERQFYARHFSLAEVGETGQQRLKQSCVLVIGAGGLGCPALQYLTAAGVGQLTICDGDRIELSNLHRQPLYRPDDTGKWKAKCAVARCLEQNPWITVKAVTTWITAENIEALAHAHDLVLDCTDNLATNVLIHDACYLTRTPLITAAIHTFEGIIHRYEFNRKHQACARCLHSDIAQPAPVDSCAERGVIGALPGIFGAMQAEIALHHLLEIKTLSNATSWIMDLKTMQSRQIGWSQRQDCPLCAASKPPSLNALHPNEPDVNITSLDTVGANARLIDIREIEERITAPFPSQFASEHRPFSAWQNTFLPMHRPCILLCATGKRSAYLAKKLHQEGHTQVYSLKGGIDALPVN